MKFSEKWGDLKQRVISAVVMLLIGAEALFFGGWAFVIVVSAVVAAMVWELTRMMTKSNAVMPYVVAALAFTVLLLGAFEPSNSVMVLALAPAILGAAFVRQDRIIYYCYCVLLVVSGFGLLRLFEIQGLIWVVWLIAVVVATDVAGYFAGKSIGGAKFWPSISPKKTWAGIIGGWAAAACVGLAFGGVMLATISVFMSFASQLGDIAESAIKRRSGVKDSSGLIPGHGGVLDRFDGLMAANLVVLIAMLMLGLLHQSG